MDSPIMARLRALAPAYSPDWPSFIVVVLGPTEGSLGGVRVQAPNAEIAADMAIYRASLAHEIEEEAFEATLAIEAPIDAPLHNVSPRHKGIRA
ncbi:hypothetical protein [Belnapia moabensis]|uniref:hypothetical protein n=1 Tax=Belnapia moabensis TaxID=365533 RepID=UPI0005BC9A8D|nr:hypothetical protein [Belnapia moabensis]